MAREPRGRYLPDAGIFVPDNGGDVSGTTGIPTGYSERRVACPGYTLDVIPENRWISTRTPHPRFASSSRQQAPRSFKSPRRLRVHRVRRAVRRFEQRFAWFAGGSARRFGLLCAKVAASHGGTKRGKPEGRQEATRQTPRMLASHLLRRPTTGNDRVSEGHALTVVKRNCRAPGRTSGAS